MIGKHVSCKPENDGYGRLARYIADAGHDGEKCLVSWSAGCWSGDDYDLGILEAEAVQDLNTRSACGHTTNADHNASLNILAAGHVVSA